MKKVVQINSVCNGSTGKIMYQIQKCANELGYDTLSIHGRRNDYKDLKCKKFGNIFSFLIHVMITFIFNRHNHGSYFQTKKIVKYIKKYNPDIIHLHNIHGYYLNNEVLFNYLNNEFKGKIIWTLHDCWAFTGHCAHFEYQKCNKWKKECKNCPLKFDYPYSWFFDTSNKEFENKKRLFSNLNNLTIVTPSVWLKSKVKQSFLNNHKCVVINNGIDLNIFKPNVDENIFSKYNIPKNKKIILGVASVWTMKKGYNTFIDLSKKISCNEIIIMVGLTKTQIKKLPNNIIGIERTENINELVSLYSIANVFVNPSYEETFSLVTVEALACGTPCVVYDLTATPELITKEVGVILKKTDVDTLYNVINNLYKKDCSKECIARAKKYSLNNFKKYIELYNNIIQIKKGDK